MQMLIHALRRAWILFTLAIVPAWAAASEPLKIGLLPTLSTRNLITNYQPLRAHLERELKRPVVLLTAPDFKAFHRDTAAGVFDLAVTAAHLARLAQTEHGMQPLATYRATNRAILVTARSRPVSSTRDLRGQNLAIFDPLALVVLQAMEWLAGQGLQAGRDYRVVDTPSHNSVAHSVLSGESILGVTAPGGMRQWTAEMRERLEVYHELPPVPALVWMAHPRMAAQIERIKAALLRFPDTPEGREFFARTGYQGLRELVPDELSALDPYAKEVARRMREGP
jgi:phosphonate transport system substrate-binding protein